MTDIDTRSITKGNTVSSVAKTIKARYADIFLQGDIVLFKCSMCNVTSTFVCTDFIQLMDHLINDHTDLPKTCNPTPDFTSFNSLKKTNGEEHCAVIFFTSHSHLVYRCASCGEDLQEFIPLLKHLLKKHYVEIDDKRLGLKRLIPASHKKDEENKTQVEANVVKDLEVNTDEDPEAISKAEEEKERILKKKAAIILIKDRDVSAAIPNETVDKCYRQEDGSYICNFCDLRVPNKQKIKSHLVTHRTERRYTCHVCNKSFKSRSTCSSHVLLQHIKEKKYQCTQCPLKFHMPNELRCHEDRHRGVRNFICSECGKGFNASGQLQLHIRRHKNIRNFECEHCQKKFITKAILRWHMRVHSNERSKECIECEAKFKSGTALQAHMKLHLDMKEYKCKVCQAGFNQLSGLHAHMKTKHQILKKKGTSIIIDIDK